jgi:hypothetical protein
MVLSHTPGIRIMLALPGAKFLRQCSVQDIVSFRRRPESSDTIAREERTL